MRGPTESVNIKAKSLYKCNLRLSLLIYYMQKLPELHDVPYTRKNRNKKKYASEIHGQKLVTDKQINTNVRLSE